MWRIACVYVARFPVQVEVQRRPELAKAPVVVTSQAEETVEWVSRAAERAGVHPGMPIRKAQALCRDLIWLPHDPVRYQEAWEQILRALYAVGPGVESPELGLAYLDVRGVPALAAGPAVLASQITAATSAHWVTRVGLSANKFVAYAAARRASPEAPQWVEPQAAAEFLTFQPLAWLPVPAEMLRRCELLGLKTMGQLARLPRGSVEAQFGRLGGRAWELCRGIDNEPLSPRPWPVPVAERLEFETPAVSRDVVKVGCRRLAEAVWKRRERGDRPVRGARLTAFLEEGHTWQRAATFKQAAATWQRFWHCIDSLLLLTLPTQPVTELLLELRGFADASEQQAILFEEENEVRARLAATVSELKARYGYSPLFRLVEVEPWTRIPERRLALVEYEP